MRNKQEGQGDAITHLRKEKETTIAVSFLTRRGETCKPLKAPHRGMYEYNGGTEKARKKGLNTSSGEKKFTHVEGESVRWGNGERKKLGKESRSADI